MESEEGYDGLEIEMFDIESTYEICVACLRLRITWTYWIKDPPPEILSVYINAGKQQELVMCFSCLDKAMGVIAN